MQAEPQLWTVDSGRDRTAHLSAFERAYKGNPADWTRDTLEPLTGDELRDLCLLLGIPHTGTRLQVTERLLTMAAIRVALSPFEDREAIVEAFRLKELQQMCRRAKIYIAGNKRGAAACLLNWRNECRKKGQTVMREAQEEARKKTRQMRLPF